MYNIADHMKKLFGYILSPIYLLFMGVILGVFHPIQVVCWNVWGYPAQKLSVDIMCYLLMKSLIILGSRMHFQGFEKLPKDCPLIIVSNHQSQYDIPPIVWGFRKHYPKFISKIQLAKGIPSISYNLRRGGSALIDRKNPTQAIKEIIKLGREIEANNYSACIFPEGTRSKDGKVNTFKVSGLATLLKTSPSAVIIPFAVNGNYLLQRFPMGVGEKLTYTVLDPIERKNRTAEEISEMCESLIKKELDQI